MPDIELLNILNINCNTIGTEKEGKGANCNANKDSVFGARIKQCCAKQRLRTELGQGKQQHKLLCKQRE